MGVGKAGSVAKKIKIYHCRGVICFLPKPISRKCSSETLSKSNYHVDNYLPLAVLVCTCNPSIWEAEEGSQ